MLIPLNAGHRLGGAAAVLLGCALLLSSCGLPRLLPDRAEPQAYVSLDVCGLVPIGELRDDHPAAEMRPTPHSPPLCLVTLYDDYHSVGAIMIRFVQRELPEAVRWQGGEGVTDESLDGGTAVHVDGDGYCGSFALADTGIWLDIRADFDSGELRRQSTCEVVRFLARSAVEQLNDDVPTVDWPEKSLFRKDICAAVDDSGLAPSLGVDTEPRVDVTHLQCRYSVLRSSDGSYRSVEVSATTSGDWSEDPEPVVQRLTIAGHRASLRDTHTAQEKPSSRGFCSFDIDFGHNAEVDRRHPRDDHESLNISLGTSSPYDCESAVPAITKLVESLD